MTDDTYWFWLASTPKIGPAAFRALVEHFGSPKAIYEADRLDYTAVSSLKRPQIESLTQHKIALDKSAAFADRQLALAQTARAAILHYDDPNYPAFLNHHHNVAPPILWVLGDLARIQQRRVAIVGTREPAEVVERRTEEIARSLSASGITVISGLAKGVDSRAHTGALEGRGTTVAVVGSGVDTVYPRENHQLHDLIASKGCIVSEFPLGYRPNPDQLRKRNKLLVAFAEVVLVAQAPLGSGAMIAARAAVEQNKPILTFTESLSLSPIASGGVQLLNSMGVAHSLNGDTVEQALDDPGKFACDRDCRKRLFEALGWDRKPTKRGEVKRATQRPAHRTRKKVVQRQWSDSELGLPGKTSGAEAKDSAFAVGDSVLHPTFGSGVVQNVAPWGEETRLEIRFKQHGVKTIVPSLVALTKTPDSQ